MPSDFLSIIHPSDPAKRGEGATQRIYPCCRFEILCFFPMRCCL